MKAAAAGRRWWWRPPQPMRRRARSAAPGEGSQRDERDAPGQGRRFWRLPGLGHLAAKLWTRRPPGAGRAVRQGPGAGGTPGTAGACNPSGGGGSDQTLALNTSRWPPGRSPGTPPERAALNSGDVRVRPRGLQGEARRSDNRGVNRARAGAGHPGRARREADGTRDRRGGDRRARRPGRGCGLVRLGSTGVRRARSPPEGSGPRLLPAPARALGKAPVRYGSRAPRALVSSWSTGTLERGFIPRRHSGAQSDRWSDVSAPWPAQALGLDWPAQVSPRPFIAPQNGGLCVVPAQACGGLGVVPVGCPRCPLDSGGVTRSWRVVSSPGLAP